MTGTPTRSRPLSELFSPTIGLVNRRVPWIGLAAYGVLLVLYAPLEPLWGDETYTAATIATSWANFISELHQADVYMGAYYALVKCVTSVLGDGELAMRLVSIAAILGAVAAIRGLTRRLFGEWAATVAAVLVAVNPFVIRIALTARPYALLFLVSIVSWWALDVAIARRSSSSRWLLWGVLAGLLMWVHLTGVLLVAAQSGFALARMRRPSWPMVAAAVVIVASGLPVLAMLGPARTLRWLKTGLFGDFAALGAALGGPLPAAAVLLSVAIGLFAFFRKRDRSENQSWALIATWFLVPLAAFLAILPVQSLFQSYYFAGFLAPLFTTAAIGVTRLSGRRVQAVAIVLVVVASVAGLAIRIPGHRVVSEENWRGVAQYLNQSVGASDVVAFSDSYWRMPIEYYSRTADGVRAARPATPDAPWGGLRPYQLGQLSGHPESVTPQVVGAQLNGAPSVWTVGWDDDAGARFGAVMKELGYRPLSSRQFGTAVVVQYTR